jgi:Inner membrane component domain/Uncharacterized alpha/beta hydrolase domain (DUF2235)
VCSCGARYPAVENQRPTCNAEVPCLFSPLLLNLLWIVFGGLWMGAGWVIAGIIMAITIVGLPWTPAAFNIASYTLLPFDRNVRDACRGNHDDEEARRAFPRRNLEYRERRSNVWRLKALCAPHGVDGSVQCAYYNAGLGTRFGEKFRGGMFGYGLDGAVIDAYEWLIENYNSDGHRYWR